jgi:hypothetical protein
MRQPCYGAAYRETLTPTGHIVLLVSVLALMWLAFPLGAAYAAAMNSVPPGNYWRGLLYATACWTCFLTVCGLFALATKWWLLPLTGEPIGSLVYFGAGGICVHWFIKSAQRPKK